MKIITKYILNSIKERKLRTLVMLLSIVLSTTLLFVSLSIGSSYEYAQKKMAIGYAGNAKVSAKSNSGDFLSKSDLVKTNTVLREIGILRTQALFQKKGYFENFDLISGKMEDIHAINAPRIKYGTLDNFKGFKIALPDRFTSQFNYKVGDKIPVKINGKIYSFELSAICNYDTIFLRNTRGFNALIPFETLSEILGTNGRYSEFLMIPKMDIDTSRFIENEVQKYQNKGVTISPIYDDMQVSADAKQKSMPFYLISFFTLTISTFIIYSSYKIIISERMKVLGTFRSIGANQRTISKILLLESLIYGVSGSLLGLPLGFTTLKIILGSMLDSTSNFGIEIPAIVTPINIVVSTITAIFVSILGAYIPSKRASRLAVKDIVLGKIEEERISNKKRISIGMLLFVTSIVLPRIASGRILTITGAISLLTLIISAIMIIPLLLNSFSVFAQMVYTKLSGNIGTIAARNLRDNKNTNSNVTLLFISISAIIVISVVGDFVNTYVTDVFRGATLDGFSQSTVDRSFIKQVEKLDTVTEVLPIYVMDEAVQVENKSLRVEATDDIKKFNEMLAINDMSNNRDEVESNFSKGRNAVVSTETLTSLNLKVGDEITIGNDSQKKVFKIIGSFKSRANDVNVILPSSFAREDFNISEYGFFAYKAKRPESVMNQIRNLYGSKSHWSRTVKQFTNDAKNTVNSFLEPMNKLTYFILGLATVGVMNNLLINFIQRKRTNAMYKSIGLSNKQNVYLCLIESFSVGLFGGGLAILVSYLEIKTVFLVAGPKISVVPSLSISTFLYAAGLGVIITILGSVVPVLKNSKLNIVEEIKVD
ncbi:ABC transporter permease [Enterococcus avium]